MQWPALLPQLPSEPIRGMSPQVIPRLVASICIGICAAVVTDMLPQAITIQGVAIGDIGPPLVGLQRALHGDSPYDILLRSGPLALYPFTTMLVLAPFLLLPITAVAPVFCGVSSSVLSWALLTGGHWWRLMAFLSVPYLMALYSVQWSPLFLAALLLPPLLPIALVKPQLGIALLAAGKWNRWSLVATSAILLLSLILRPTWPIEWIQSGVTRFYDSRVPLLIAPGLLLAAAVFFVRSARGRLVLTMALIPQRFYYDQLLLFFIPTSWRQMVFLLVISWTGAAWSLHTGAWNPASGYQIDAVWRVVVWTLYLPALAILAHEWWTTVRGRKALHDAAESIGD